MMKPKRETPNWRRVLVLYVLVPLVAALVIVALMTLAFAGK